LKKERATKRKFVSLQKNSSRSWPLRPRLGDGSAGPSDGLPADHIHRIEAALLSVLLSEFAQNSAFCDPARRLGQSFKRCFGIHPMGSLEEGIMGLSI